MVHLAVDSGANTIAVELDISQLADLTVQSFVLDPGNTSTAFSVDNGFVRFDVTGQNFSYSSGINPQAVSGTINTFAEVILGPPDVPHYSLSGLNLDLAPVIANPAVLEHLFDGADTLIGSGEADFLDGGPGNDHISGGAGNDVITGGRGNDTMTGGAGNDKFAFATGFGKDVITDFSAGPAIGDVIAISHKLFANLAAVKAHSHVDVHHHVVIEYNASNTITLNTVHHVSDLKPNDFLFT